MLKNLLSRKRDAILARWRSKVFETYSPDTARFFGQQTDPFRNPVGEAIKRGTEAILGAVLAGEPVASLEPCLDDVIRVRAVQDFSPSQAVGFVFLLKDAVRDVLGDDARLPDVEEDLAALDRHLDEVALRAFDVYMKCREKVFEIRANELRNRTSLLLERLQRRRGEPDSTKGDDS